MDLFAPKRGRPKGAKSKIMSHRTAIYRDCYTEDDIISLATKHKKLMLSDEVTPTEFAQLFKLFLQYNIHSVDAEEALDAVSSISSISEAEARLKELQARIAESVGK